MMSLGGLGSQGHAAFKAEGGEGGQPDLLSACPLQQEGPRPPLSRLPLVSCFGQGRAGQSPVAAEAPRKHIPGVQAPT